MTAQASDSLFHDGQHFWLASEPLGGAWAHRGRDAPFFVPMNTACWRGYVARWAIRDGRLYLTGLEGTVAHSITDEELLLGREGSEGPATLETLFPGEPPPIPADWVTGTLHARRGELLHYVHMGYESTFQESRFIDVVDGRVTGERVVDNGRPPDPPKSGLRRLLDRLRGRRRSG